MEMKRKIVLFLLLFGKYSYVSFFFNVDTRDSQEIAF